MHRYVLALGANLGDRLLNLKRAVYELARRGEILALSSVWETEAREMGQGIPDFLNAALKIRTYLAPDELLKLVKALEASFGRDLSQTARSRPLDIDIITWSGGEYSAPGLEIPHPRAGERAFVVRPYNEVSNQPLPEPKDPQRIKRFAAAKTLRP